MWNMTSTQQRHLDVLKWPDEEQHEAQTSSETHSNTWGSHQRRIYGLCEQIISLLVDRRSNFLQGANRDSSARFQINTQVCKVAFVSGVKKTHNKLRVISRGHFTVERRKAGNQKQKLTWRLNWRTADRSWHDPLPGTNTQHSRTKKTT